MRNGRWAVDLLHQPRQDQRITGFKPARIFTYASAFVLIMTYVQQANGSETAAACVARAGSFLAVCSRPALSISSESRPEELYSALTELVAVAELFGCKPAFWRWAAEAASLLGRPAEAEIYRTRAPGEA